MVLKGVKGNILKESSGGNNLLLSHPQFVDDIIFFGSDKDMYLVNLTCILSFFKSFSGQNINRIRENARLDLSPLLSWIFPLVATLDVCHFEILLWKRCKSVSLREMLFPQGVELL